MLSDILIAFLVFKFHRWQIWIILYSSAPHSITLPLNFLLIEKRSLALRFHKFISNQGNAWSMRSSLILIHSLHLSLIVYASWFPSSIYRRRRKTFKSLHQYIHRRPASHIHARWQLIMIRSSWHDGLFLVFASIFLPFSLIESSSKWFNLLRYQIYILLKMMCWISCKLIRKLIVRDVFIVNWLSDKNVCIYYITKPPLIYELKYNDLAFFYLDMCRKLFMVIRIESKNGFKACG